MSATVLVIVALAAIGGYSYGASTRMADDAVVTLVGTRVDQAVASRSARAHADQRAAVRGARSMQRSRDNRRWRKRLNKAVKKAQQAGYASGQAAGYSSGSAAGYSSGSAAGYSSGKSAGVQEGIDKASDELVCSDDLDVDLPPCFDY